MTAHARNMPAPLPDCIEAEQALLGSMLTANDTYWRVAGFLKPIHFGEPLHASLYETMGTMIAEGRPVNAITVKPYLRTDQMVGDKPVFLYVVELMREAVGTAAAYENGRAIIEMWARRRLISAAADLDTLARNMPIDMTPEKLIGEVAGTLTSIAQEGNERAASNKYGVILPKAIDRAHKASNEASSLIPWFLPEATAVAGDIRRGNLIGFMSDSGGGKTSFALSQCRHAALQGHRAAFFSIEITEEEAALQAAAQAARVPLSRLDAFTLTTREQQGVEDELMRSLDLPFEIVPFADCALSDIGVKLEAMVKSRGLDFVAIDHAKMIALPGKSGELFAERVNALYRGLKALAKRLNVAIMILIQRNDDWKKRFMSNGSIRPIMGDAYGGGSVKQNLDVWFSLYRPEPLYRELIPIMPPERQSDAAKERGEKTRRQKLIEDVEDAQHGVKGKAWLINHKRRRGEPQGSQQINFIAECTLFASPNETAEPAFDGFEGF